MPVTIRPSVVKIKKPSTGEYREINALLDTDSAKTVYYGVSSTAADTQTKTVTIEGITELSDGLLVRILFSNSQSYSGTPKLQINSTTASNIKWTTGADASTLTWAAGEVLDFVYVSSASGFVVLDRKAISDLNTALAPVVGTTAVSTEAGLIGASKFFNATANIALGNTGVTLEAYARGAVFSSGNTGSIIGIGYSGKIYTAFFADEAIVHAEEFHSNIFAVRGTLISNVSTSGNIFNQTETDSRITSSTKIANIIFPGSTYIMSPDFSVTTNNNGTVTVTGTTYSFSGTVDVIIELYN